MTSFTGSSSCTCQRQADSVHLQQTDRQVACVLPHILTVFQHRSVIGRMEEELHCCCVQVVKHTGPGGAAQVSSCCPTVHLVHVEMLRSGLLFPKPIGSECVCLFPRPLPSPASSLCVPVLTNTAEEEEKESEEEVPEGGECRVSLWLLLEPRLQHRLFFHWLLCGPVNITSHTSYFNTDKIKSIGKWLSNLTLPAGGNNAC